MFSTFHFAKVVLHLRSFPLTWHLSHADWSGTAGWRPCLRGAHPWQKGSGHPLLVSAMTQVHAQERASGPSCWLMWVALEQSESGPPGSFRPSFWHFSRRSMSLSALPSSRQITVMTKGSWKFNTRMHTLHGRTATASYLVGKWEQIVCIFLS